MSRTQQVVSKCKLTPVGVSRQSVVPRAYRLRWSVRRENDSSHCGCSSKYIDAHVMTSSTTAATILRLRQPFATPDLPCTLVSDNGTAFTSHEIQNFCRSNSIKHIRSAPFHPASNGLAEITVQTIKDGLKKINSGDLETRMYQFLSRYRVTLQTTTGQTPAEMLMSK